MKIDNLGHSKVSYLGLTSVRYQDVACSQVTVDNRRLTFVEIDEAKRNILQKRQL